MTDRHCEKRVKFYDRKCPGLYVSITTAGVASFSLRSSLYCHQGKADPVEISGIAHLKHSDMIRTINAEWSIPIELLTSQYELARTAFRPFAPLKRGGLGGLQIAAED